jgi:hypothetical protein
MSSDRAAAVQADVQVAAPSRAILHFCVWRPPVSTNAQYKRVTFQRRVKGKIQTVNALSNSAEAADFKDAVRAHAIVATQRAAWPKPEIVQHVAVKIVVWNTKHDCSAAEKLCLDGMEGVVYANDRVAHPRLNDIDSDGGKPRVEIVVELLRAL